MGQEVLILPLKGTRRETKRQRKKKEVWEVSGSLEPSHSSDTDGCL